MKRSCVALLLFALGFRALDLGELYPRYESFFLSLIRPIQQAFINLDIPAHLHFFGLQLISTSPPMIPCVLLGILSGLSFRPPRDEAVVFVSIGFAVWMGVRSFHVSTIFAGTELEPTRDWVISRIILESIQVPCCLIGVATGRLIGARRLPKWTIRASLVLTAGIALTLMTLGLENLTVPSLAALLLALLTAGCLLIHTRPIRSLAEP